MRRVNEALDWLDRAHALYPSEDSGLDETERRIIGWVETSIQVSRATCLLTLDRFGEAYEAASQVVSRDVGDLATFALQHMAECRIAQGRVSEALALYADLKMRLPCRLVNEDRVRQGITNCMSYLEKLHPGGRPS